MFAGIGGLDLACEWHWGAETAWQLDLIGADVRRRHWPNALQVEADVRQVDPVSLPAVDILCGGFPCQDLSVAGSHAGLTGERSGLYREMLRYAAALRPRFVVMENVPGLLRYAATLELDWAALGYGLTWVKCRALDAGAPHLRARVFVVAEVEAVSCGVIEAQRQSRAVRPWPTAVASNPNEGEDPRCWHARQRHHRQRGRPLISEPLAQTVRPWATPRATGADAGLRKRVTKQGAHLSVQIRTWPTATAQDAANNAAPSQWERNAEPLNVSAATQPGKRLNPDWVETLMGYPIGWTLTQGEQLTASRAPRWPRGRYPSTWDRSQLWLGHRWEPSRTLPDGPPARGRPARLRALGNAVCPQQGALALATWARPAQIGLFQVAP